MAWIEFHQSLRTHPKLKKLARILDVRPTEAAGILGFLWWWALDYAQDGDLSKYDDEEIAEAAGWEGDAPALIDALASCGRQGEPGFLDRRDGGLILHDWFDYAGKLIDRRREDAERKRAARSKPSPGRPPDRRRTSRVPNHDDDQPIPNRNDSTLAPARESAPSPLPGAEQANESDETPSSSKPIDAPPLVASGATGAERKHQAPGGQPASGPWAFGVDELALLTDACGDLDIRPADLPGKIGVTLHRRVTQGDYDQAVYDAWYAMAAPTVAAWCQRAMALAREAGRDRAMWVRYATGIVASSLEARADLLVERRKVVSMPKRQGKPADAELSKRKAWW